jgi:hypothetical protein
VDDMKLHQSKGNTLGEYALLLGLLGALAVSGLHMLGFSVNNLLGASTQGPQKDALTKYYDNTLGAKVALTGSPSSASSTGTNGTNAAAGSLSAETPISTNVTSVEGTNHFTLGTLRLASSLDQLAQQTTDPVTQAYFAQLAKLSYYIGANEGELDDFGTYSLGSKYSNADALNDLLSKQSQLQALMNNPPPGVSQQDLAQVLPLTAEVDRVASSYKSALQSVLGPDGEVHTEFSIRDGSLSGPHCGLSTCQDMVLQTNNKRWTVQNTSYDSLVSYDQVKAQAQTTLSSNPVSADPPVIATLDDATQVDSAASGGWSGSTTSQTTASGGWSGSTTNQTTASGGWSGSTTNQTAASGGWPAAGTSQTGTFGGWPAAGTNQTAFPAGRPTTP